MLLKAVMVTASTHKAALIIGGKTVHSALYFDSRTAAFLVNMNKADLASVRYIIIDEAGMLAWTIVRALLDFKKANPTIRFILIMDPLQLPPVEHRIKAMKYDMSENPLLMELCDYNRISLTVNHRNPDLVRLYEMLIRRQDVREHVGKRTDTELHIVYDNWRRREFGQQVAEKLCRAGKRKRCVLKGRDSEGLEKTLWVFKTARLYATQTIRGQDFMDQADDGQEDDRGMAYVNQEDFRVMSFDNETVQLRSTTRTGAKHIITVPKAQVLRDYEYAYARTMYGVQGETINEPYTIHRWDGLQPWDKNVAIGRARRTEYINICPGCDICNTVSKVETSDNSLNEEFRAASLEEQKALSLVIINRILRGSCSYDFAVEHTGMGKEQLMAHLRVIGGIPKGWTIDHIKARSKFTSDDIHLVNHFSNLQIVPKIINELKGTKNIRFYE